MDGSAKDDLITEGGIIRDENGDLVAVFSSFYGNGIDLCKTMEIMNVVVECDSQLVANAMINVYIYNWRLQNIFRVCLNSFHAYHGVPQTNQVADRHAAWPQIHKGRVDISREQDLHHSGA